jgi:hypothetical protein
VNLSARVALREPRIAPPGSAALRRRSRRLRRMFKEFGFFDTWRTYSLRSAIHNLVFELSAWAFRKINGNNYRGLTVKFVDDFDGTGSHELLKFNEEARRNAH